MFNCLTIESILEISFFEEILHVKSNVWNSFYQSRKNSRWLSIHKTMRITTGQEWLLIRSGQIPPKDNNTWKCITPIEEEKCHFATSAIREILSFPAQEENLRVTCCMMLASDMSSWPVVWILPMVTVASVAMSLFQMLKSRGTLSLVVYFGFCSECSFA